MNLEKKKEIEEKLRKMLESEKKEQKQPHYRTGDVIRRKKDDTADRVQFEAIKET